MIIKVVTHIVQINLDMYNDLLLLPLLSCFYFKSNDKLKTKQNKTKN